MLRQLAEYFHINHILPSLLAAPLTEVDFRILFLFIIPTYACPLWIKKDRYEMTLAS